MQYGFSKTVEHSFQTAKEKVTEALQNEGFGILTTIDVKDTLKQKLNVDFQNYVILGACNPLFAHRALQTEEEIGLLLPCNILVYEKEGKTIVALFDPSVIKAISEKKELHSLADEVQQKLLRVFAALK
jgi:uncharacterized protein (DUF302 family)